MSEQEQPVEQASSTNSSGEPTQIGQFPQPGGRPTRQLESTQQQPAQPAQQRQNAALRERIVTLVAALGDTEHPLHQQAVQDLVAIGDPAVPALNEALNPRRPWLTSFRAAEALGQIGDGRATSALIEALRHPNSNVRWGAVRALAVIGDARAMLDLRRLAREDRSKTTWGESLAGAAESALDQMRSQNVLFRSAELMKTALACVLMLLALVAAVSVITTLRTELSRIGHDTLDTNALFAPITPTPNAQATPEATAGATPEAGATPVAGAAQPAPEVGASNVVTGTVMMAANVRSEPNSQGGTANKIGSLNPGDDIVFLATTSDGKWYRIQLGQRYKASSRIDSTDGTGWVIATLLSKPEGSLPIEEATQPTPEPTEEQSLNSVETPLPTLQP